MAKIGYLVSTSDGGGSDLGDLLISRSAIFEKLYVLAWGSNSSFATGTGNQNATSTPLQTPTQVASTTVFDWRKISAGKEFGAAIRTDGTLWMWGKNSTYQTANLGTGANSFPQAITNNNSSLVYKQIYAGGEFCVALKDDGLLYSWGSNSDGQCGHNSSNATTIPSLISLSVTGKTWSTVSCGFNNFAAICTTGDMWVCGNNSFGQQSRGSGNTAAVKVLTAISLPTGMTNSNWQQVSCGSYHTAAIKTDGTLWTCGLNDKGQLGNGDTITQYTFVQQSSSSTNWKKVSCGFNHTAAIKTDGTLWTWGDNSSGQLGNGLSDSTSHCTATQTTSYGNNWVEVSCSNYQTTARKADNSLWSWGDNSSSQLGIGSGGSAIPNPRSVYNGATNFKTVASFCSGTTVYAIVNKI